MAGDVATAGIYTRYEFLAGIAPLGETHRRLHQPGFGRDRPLVELGAVPGEPRFDADGLVIVLANGHGTIWGHWVRPEKVVAGQPTPLERDGHSVSGGRHRWPDGDGVGPPDGHGPPFQLFHLGLGAQPETEQARHQGRAGTGISVQDEVVGRGPVHAHESVQLPLR